MNPLKSVLILAAVFSVSFCLELSAQTEQKSQASSSRKEDGWKPLLGKWQCQSAKLGGQDIPKQVTDKTKLSMTKGEYVAETLYGSEKGKLELNAGVTPGQMKIESKSAGESKTLLAIYKIEKGELILCYSFGDKFPEKFESTEENGFLLAKYKKVTQDKAKDKK